MKFCNEAFKWFFKGHEWTQFLNARNGKAIYGPSFNINNIIFKCSVCPNGFKKYESNQVKFWLEIEQIPSNMSIVWIYYEIYNQETRSAWKDSIRITHNSVGHGTAWKQKLKLSQCKELNLKAMTFYYFVELIKIEYLPQSQEIRPISIPSVEMSDRYEYQWIAGKMSTENKIYLSRNFDNACWYSFCNLVFVDKYTIRDYLITKFNVGFKLIRLPLNVTEVMVKYCITCDNGKEKVQGRKQLKLGELKNRQVVHTFQLESKTPYKYLPIKVSIEIVNKYSY